MANASKNDRMRLYPTTHETREWRTFWAAIHEGDLTVPTNKANATNAGAVLDETEVVDPNESTDSDDDDDDDDESSPLLSDYGLARIAIAGEKWFSVMRYTSNGDKKSAKLTFATPDSEGVLNFKTRALAKAFLRGVAYAREFE